MNILVDNVNKSILYPRRQFCQNCNKNNNNGSNIGYYNKCVAPLYSNYYYQSFCGKNIKINNVNELTYEILNNAKGKAENFLGFGAEGFVYRIPNSDYCIKIPRCTYEINNLNFLVNEQDKVNHVVGKADGGITIMKYIAGENLFDIREKNIADIYTLPDKSYKELLKAISKAYKLGMSFDSGANNIIYDSKNKKLIPIDFYKTTDKEGDYPLSNLYACVKYVMPFPVGSFDYNQFINKFLTIILEALYEGKKSEIVVNKSDIEKLFSKFEEENPNKYPPQFNFLKESLKYMAEINDNVNMKKNCNNEYKYSKCIIDQIFS